MPRNPHIIRVLYLAGLIEEYGSGIGRILNSFNDAKLPEPDFKEEFNGFSIYMWKKHYTEEELIDLGLNERQIEAIRYITKLGSISILEYSKIFSEVSDRTLQRDIRDLVQKGILNIVKETKGRKYGRRR